MKLFLPYMTFSIASLTILYNIAPAFAKPAPTKQPCQSPQKTVDLTIAIDLLESQVSKVI